MLSPEKSAKLENLLGGLPAQAAMRLASAIEVDRLAGGAELPHDMILRPCVRLWRVLPIANARRHRCVCSAARSKICIVTQTAKENRRAASHARTSPSCGTGSARR